MPGMFRKIIASGVAAKLVQEARKPQNQEKAKQLFAQWQQKRRNGGTAGHGARGRSIR